MNKGNVRKWCWLFTEIGLMCLTRNGERTLLWSRMIWMQNKCKNSGTQAINNFWLIWIFSWCVSVSDPRNCYQVPPLQETLCHILGAKHVDRRPQRETHESWNYLFGALLKRRLWVSRPHCHGRWNLDCLHHTRKQAAVLTLVTYWVPRSEKFQADDEGAENHGYSFLGHQRRHLHEIPATKGTHQCWFVLWNARVATQGNSQPTTRCTDKWSLLHDNSQLHTAAHSGWLLEQFNFWTPSL